MFGSQTLEVAIGLVFCYLLLALICSALNEWGAQMLATRAQTLEEGIRTMLNDRDGTGFAAKVYDHPLIKGFTGTANWFARLPLIRNWTQHAGKPSYMPPRAFALALIDSVMPAGGGPRNFDEFRAAVAALPNEQLRKSLLVLVDEAGGDLKKAQTNIETWFSHCMERVTGWYKRRARWVALGWAVVITLVLNADTLKIANTLWTDSTQRAAVVASAEAYVKQNPPTQGSGASIPQEAMKNLQQAVSQSKIPLGWTSIESRQGWIHGFAATASKAGWSGVFIKLVGLLGTALAVSLGAPFWFNTLKDLGALRSAGGVPESGKQPEARADELGRTGQR